MSGFNLRHLKVWAKEINAMGETRVCARLCWDKDVSKDMYPHNIKQALRTYIQSLENSVYACDENLGYVGMCKMTDFDLKKCEAEFVIACSNAKAFPPMIVHGLGTVKRKVII